MTLVLLVRQLPDTLELALAGAEGAEGDGTVRDARGCGRPPPRRGGAKRRVREQGITEQSSGLPVLLSPALLPSEDASQPVDDLLVEQDSVHALVPPPEGLRPGFAEYSRLEDLPVRCPRPAFLAFADMALAVGLLDLRDDHFRRAEEVAVVRPFGLGTPQVVLEVEAVEAKLPDTLIPDFPG